MAALPGAPLVDLGSPVSECIEKNKYLPGGHNVIYCGLNRNCSSGYRLWKAAICIIIASLTILLIVLFTALSPFLSELSQTATIPCQRRNTSPRTSVVPPAAAMPLLGAASADTAALDLGMRSIVVGCMDVWGGYRKVLGVWWYWGCWEHKPNEE